MGWLYSPQTFKIGSYPNKDIENMKLHTAEPSKNSDHPEEEGHTDPEHHPRKGIYLLPNLLTTSALFAGFYAIIAAINENYVASAIAIFVAMVLDTLDGRVARMTGTQSAFGAEYDSLSDVIAFGLAPALIAFLWSLHDLGKVGWVCSFVYVAGTALRLARFNTHLETADKRFFTGLASPAAAAVIAGSIWVLTEMGVSGQDVAIPFAIIVAASGLLMVSNIRYYSFKLIGHRIKVPFMVMVLVVFVFALVAIDPATVLVSTAYIYASSGPIYELWAKFKQKRG